MRHLQKTGDEFIRRWLFSGEGRGHRKKCHLTDMERNFDKMPLTCTVDGLVIKEHPVNWQEAILSVRF
jgi:hypothetical protein